MLLSLSVNSISSIPSPVYQSKKAFLRKRLVVNCSLTSRTSLGWRLTSQRLILNWKLSGNEECKNQWHNVVLEINRTQSSRKHRKRAKVARIALVKPHKVRGVEDVILRAAQMGQIVEKVSEEKLISLLEQINSQTSKQTKVTIQRR
ncbi:hypothetical protein NE237_032970 [Protea cynaroides]|uniref:Uncharacterized protein n=1 Tax=Protea cynaroides TaxID=273540 RepID=A0A9Q0L401_9MAGN|nr:hypothetical protein NE237_032970 [Protea cynaroides]